MGTKGADSVQAAAIGHNKGNLKKGLERIQKIDIAVQKLKADRMNVFNELDEQGFDRKEVAAIVKIKTKPKDLSFKRGVNQMCLQLDLPEEFNLSPEQLQKLESEENETEEKEEEAA